MVTRNPYAARGPHRPWLIVDFGTCPPIVHGRYHFKWMARLAAMGVLDVVYQDDSKEET